VSVKRLSTFLESVLVDTLGLPAAATQVRLLRSWGEIVGPLLSGKTAPGKIRNGVLTVFVPNHAWAQELQLSTPALLERIRSVAGGEKVRDIRFAVDSGNCPPAGEESRCGDEAIAAPGAIASCDDIPTLEPNGLEEVHDPETREILRSLYRKSSREEK
jgi:hypothetical protein